MDGQTAIPTPPERIALSDCEDGQRIRGVYAVRERELRRKKNGDPWLRLRLGDASGTAEAVCWEDWRALIQPVRSDAAILPLIDVLPKYPVITAAVAEGEIGRSRPATINALAQLGAEKILTRHRNQKKGDSWEAKELFALLSRFEEAARLPLGS